MAHSDSSRGTEMKSRSINSLINSQTNEKRPMSNHLDRTSSANKGFSTWLLGKMFLQDTAGSPERPR